MTATRCVCVCVCVVSIILRRPALPPCMVDGRYRNPLYYYYSKTARPPWKKSVRENQKEMIRFLSKHKKASMSKSIKSFMHMNTTSLYTQQIIQCRSQTNCLKYTAWNFSNCLMLLWPWNVVKVTESSVNGYNASLSDGDSLLPSAVAKVFLRTAVLTSPWTAVRTSPWTAVRASLWTTVRASPWTAARASPWTVIRDFPWTAVRASARKTTTAVRAYSVNICHG